MRRLAVCGWDDETPALLRALEEHAGLQATVVGDPRAAALVRARTETGLPCYQHVRQMLQSAEYDALLLGAAGMTASATHARLSAERGATLLMRGEHAGGEALEAAAAAALDHGVATAILRPRLGGTGPGFLLNLMHAQPAWTPQFASIEVAGDLDAHAMLRDVVALAARLVDATASQVALSIVGPDPDAPLALAAHLRYASGALLQCSARRSDERLLRMHIEAAAGSFTLETSDDVSRIVVRAQDGEPQTSVLPERDGLEHEARRIGGGIGAEDGRLALREAAMLRALEGSLSTGYVHGVQDPGVRASLRVLRGGGRAVAQGRPVAVRELRVPALLHIVS